MKIEIKINYSHVKTRIQNKNDNTSLNFILK